MTFPSFSLVLPFSFQRKNVLWKRKMNAFLWCKSYHNLERIYWIIYVFLPLFDTPLFMFFKGTLYCEIQKYQWLCSNQHRSKNGCDDFRLFYFFSWNFSDPRDNFLLKAHWRYFVHVMHPVIFHVNVCNTRFCGWPQLTLSR